MADKFKIKNPKALFRRSLRKAPAHPRGDRILVRELPPESVTEGGIALAEEGKERFMAGVVIAAGDQAADAMYDGGDELGDLIMYAKYAGVVQEWQHIVGPDDPTCEHDGGRDHIAKPSATLDGLRTNESAADKKTREARERKWEIAGGAHDNITLRECRACGTLIVSERMIVMSVDDIHLNVDLQERLESGEMVRFRGETDDGKTRHYIVRTTRRPDCFGGVEQTSSVERNMQEVA